MSRFCHTDLGNEGVPLEDMEAAETQDDADLWLSRLVPDFN
jgi:hypothetical protein